MISVRQKDRGTWLARLLALSMALAALAEPAFAQGLKEQGFAHSAKLLEELLALFVVVTLLESAMATIFQWRVYRVLFNARGFKTVVMVLLGWLVVRAFDYDVFARILALSGQSPNAVKDTGLVLQLTGFSGFLSALIIAGGSAGINSLLRSLGFRAVAADAEAAPVLDATEAWISVTIRRHRSAGPVQVLIEEAASRPDPAVAACMGVVDSRPALQRVLDALFANQSRVPSYGGRKVKANTVYTIWVTGHAKPQPGSPEDAPEIKQKVYHGAFASRAVIDLVATV
jgi:hypothetical protein